MRLDNFALVSPFAGAELVGLGHRWDLHNVATFAGMRFLPERDEVWLEWTVPSGEANPWGSPVNTATGCRLRFLGVTHLEMSGRVRAYPPGEGGCLESVSKAIPGNPEHPFKNAWEADEPFHLRFEFQDQRECEIGAVHVLLETM